ncbi:MAG: hypothetical protein WC374_13650, partial [Phycisphaerae bacterium]
LLNHALKANGIKLEIMAVDICPALMAEEEARQAKRKLGLTFEVVAKLDKPITSAAALDKVANLICAYVHAIEAQS